jgi:signal recognition particle subunit SRP68
VLSAGTPSDSSPRNLLVTQQDVQSLHDLLSGEMQQLHALVEISNLRTSKGTSEGKSSSRPLIERLGEYPAVGVDLENVVVYPPKLEPVPVKPLFLDVAWNYIEYSNRQAKSAAGPGPSSKAAAEAEAKTQKRGWFGFGR